MKLLKRLFREEEGVTMVEYGILVAVIALVVMVGAGIFGDALNAAFQSLAGMLW